MGFNLITPLWCWHMSMPRKETIEKSEGKEMDQDTEGKTFTSTQGTLALIEDEEQNGKQKKEEIGDEGQNRKQKKETGSETPSQLPWTMWLPPTTRRDHTVGLF